MGKDFDEFMKLRETIKTNNMNNLRVKLRHIQIGIDDEISNQKLLRTILKTIAMLNSLSDTKV